jgi:5-methylcytosine-specific restriction endonuclease McrA
MTVRPCLGYPGYRCGRLVRAGSRCDDCRRAGYRARERVRDPFTRSLYGSAAWRRLAYATVAAAEACHWCQTPATVTKLTADHIASARTHPELATEPSNIVASCRSCQERRKLRPDPATWTEWERHPWR